MQERWFARLYLLKALIIATLVVFWVASGLIALTVAYGAAVGILAAHGFAVPLVHAATVVRSLVDIGVGVAVPIGARAAWNSLWASRYPSSTWRRVEPLGALVKTGPAIVLMLAALAMLDER